MITAETLDCKNLEPGSLIDVETTSRHYKIECLGGRAIRISGHPQYCPDPVDAEIQGSVTREGFLEEGIIERGTRLAFLIGRQFPVTTSKVLNVHVEQPDSAYRVH